MKILALRGKNIASLTEFVVDFQAEPLHSAGIFAITGPTGSGKSSLLDAMCLALYQKAPRLDDLTGREAKMESRFGSLGQDDIRNLLRRGCDTGFAECDFLATDGHSYRARWGYRAAKKAGAAVQEEMALVRLTDQQVLVSGASRKSDFKNRIEELVGLSYSQFTRTVLLAQGRFAEFLRSNQDERSALLEKLTGTSIYSRISQGIHERATEVRKRCDDLEAQRAQLKVLLPQERTDVEAELHSHQTRIPTLETTLGVIALFQSLVEREQVLSSQHASVRKQWDALCVEQEISKQALQNAQNLLTAQQSRRTELAPFLEKARTLDAQLEQSFAQIQERQTVHQGLEAKHKEQQERLQTLHGQSEQLALQIQANQSWIEIRRPKLASLVEQWSLWEERLLNAEKLRKQQQHLSNTVLPAENKNRDGLTSEVAATEQKLSEFTLDDTADPDAIQVELTALRQQREELQTLPAYLERHAEQAALQAELETESTQLEALRTQLPLREEAWKMARKMLDTTTLVASQNVGHLRSQLEEQQPCMVCGSLEHPWAQSNPALDEVLLGHTQVEALARQEFDTVRSQIEKKSALKETLTKNLTKVHALLAQVSVSDGLLAQAMGEVDAVAWAKAQLQNATQNEARLHELLQTLHKRDALRAQANLLHERLQAQIARIQQFSSELEHVSSDLSANLRALDEAFGDSAWQAKWSDNPAFLQQLREGVQQYLVKQQDLDRDQRAQEPLLATIKSVQQTVSELDQQREQSQQKLSEVLLVSQDLQQQRSLVLDGKSAKEVEAQLEAAVQKARESLDLEIAKSQKVSESLALLEGHLSQIQEQRETLSQQLESVHSQLFEEPTHSDVELLSSAKEQATVLSEELRQLRQNVARIEMALQHDDASKAQSEILRQKLSKERANQEQWSLLNAQIGSADGKLFRRIAQEFTLEILLEEANRQLATIAPRYCLKILPPMHIGVLDRENFDEMRPVHTLSGGETFLVSLALALGLSRMAGGDLRVESLFIDEGFGTLDGDTLQGVMGALSGLHSQGRKVGLITHVEEMKEQIPAQIRVIKLGQGTSRLEVIG